MIKFKELIGNYITTYVINLCRYNPMNVGDLTKCVERMVSDNVYDKDVCLTILKLFQLNPGK